MHGHVGERERAHDELVLLDRVHAAQLRAERVADLLVARPRAGDVGDAVRDLAVAGAQDGVEGSRGCEQPVHLHAGDDVGVGAVAVLGLEVGGEELVAGGDDHGCDLDLDLGVLHVQADGVGRAGFHAFLALRADAAVEAGTGSGEGLGLGHRRLELGEVGRRAGVDGVGADGLVPGVAVLPGEDVLVPHDTERVVEEREAV